MRTMHHIACTLAFSALIAGQFCAVIIAGTEVSPPRGRPGSGSRTTAIVQGRTAATAALLGVAGSISAFG